MEHPIVAFMTRSKAGLPDEPGGQRDCLRFDPVLPKGNHIRLFEERAFSNSMWVGLVQPRAALGLWIEDDHRGLFVPAFECVDSPAADLRRAKAFRRAYCESLDIKAVAGAQVPALSRARRSL